jgi:hypothetical protein
VLLLELVLSFLHHGFSVVNVKWHRLETGRLVDIVSAIVGRRVVVVLFQGNPGLVQ